MIPVDTIAAGNTLGEGVLWDDETQSLWWTDIEESRLHCLDWASRTRRSFRTPERLGSFAFIRGHWCMVAAFESGFAVFHPETGTTKWLGRPCQNRPGMRFNDGRTDRLGRFWAGSMAETDAGAGSACLYRLDGSGHVSCQQTDISISNSICWSPDGTIFYFADTPKRTIWRYRSDPSSGVLSERSVFAETPHDSYPDGATVDADGYVWCAHWNGSRVVRYAPDGRTDRTLEVPARQPTCVAFGGPNLDLLFVTSAKIGLSGGGGKDGDVFIYEAGVKGLPECRFMPDKTLADLIEH